MKSIQPLSRYRVGRNGSHCCLWKAAVGYWDVFIPAYQRQSLISDVRSLWLRVPDATVFYKELQWASETSPSWPAAGSPCHGMLSPARKNYKSSKWLWCTQILTLDRYFRKATEKHIDIVRVDQTKHWYTMSLHPSSALLYFDFLCECKFHTEVLWSEAQKPGMLSVNVKQTFAFRRHKHH